MVFTGHRFCSRTANLAGWMRATTGCSFVSSRNQGATRSGGTNPSGLSSVQEPHGHIVGFTEVRVQGRAGPRSARFHRRGSEGYEWIDRPKRCMETTATRHGLQQALRCVPFCPRSPSRRVRFVFGLSVARKPWWLKRLFLRDGFVVGSKGCLCLQVLVSVRNQLAAFGTRLTLGLGRFR